MKRKSIIIVLSVLLLALFWVGAVYAQEDTGYPIDTPTPTETKPPTEEPTVDPTEAPTEDPTQEPTEDPTQGPTEAPTETPAPTEAPVPTEEPTPEPTLPPNDDSPVCVDGLEHPVLTDLAARFNVSYEEIVGYFCADNLGVGEIAKALITVEQSGGTVDLVTLFSMRFNDGMGWGEIWQALGLSGGDHGGVGLLKKDQERNKHEERIVNEGEDTEIQNAASHRSEKDKPLRTPPGQVENGVVGCAEFLPPGQEGKMDDGKPGNGPKH